MLTLGRLLATVALGSVTACQPIEGARRTHDLVFRTESDLHVPLSGVAIWADDIPLGKSENGSLATALETESGRTVSVRHTCPRGYFPPDGIVSVSVRPLQAINSEGSRTIEVTLTCVAQTHIAAFVVRAPHAPALRVLLGGVEVAHTHSKGATWFSRTGAPNTEYVVTIDTSEHPLLIPVSPTRTFTLRAEHEVFVFDQEFKVIAPSAKRRRRRRIIKIE